MDILSGLDIGHLFVVGLVFGFGFAIAQWLWGAIVGMFGRRRVA